MKTLTIDSHINRYGNIKLNIPTDMESGDIELVLVINPKKSKKNRSYDFSGISGKLEWKGDAVKEQRRLRDEW